MAITIADMVPGTLNCFQGVGKVKKGENILILTDVTVDKDVVEAYRIGAEIAGAKVAILTVTLPEVGGDPALILEKVFAGEWPVIAWNAMKAADQTLHLCGFTDVHSICGRQATLYGLKHGEYDIFNVHKIRLIRSELFTKEGLASDWAKYPQPLLDYMGLKAHEQVRDAGGNLDTAKIRITDPQGTDLTCNGFAMLTKYNLNADNVKPFYMFGSMMLGISPHLPEPSAEGVVVSTSLHTGPIPPMRITLKGGRGVKIEGGGEAGVLWRQKWEEGKDQSSVGRVSMGAHKGLGVNWFEEIMYGIHPKAFRNTKYRYEGGLGWQSWVGGSRRSGVVHMAFGGGIDKYYSHRDVEIFHPTLTINGHVIIEHGRLKLLDDPDVRKEAEKYGDPNELLREHWIPELQATFPE